MSDQNQIQKVQADPVHTNDSFDEGPSPKPKKFIKHLKKESSIHREELLHGTQVKLVRAGLKREYREGFW